MPNFGQTPEALLGRNDSKNPNTTCKGITSSGRPCRRALAISKSPTSTVSGVVAVVRGDGNISAADFFCWQHKDQAEVSEPAPVGGKHGRKPARRSTELYPLQERTSIDTLMQRLNIDDNPKPKIPAPKRSTHQDPKKQRPPQKTQPKKKGFWSSLCCVMEDQDDYVEIVRHRKRVAQAKPTQDGMSEVGQGGLAGTTSVPVRPIKSNPMPFRPVAQHTDSGSGHLLSLIPPHLPPQTSSILLAELAKPISPHDEEGYIYIFWLTPQSKQPAAETARSLLTPSRPAYDRRLSDVMSEYSAPDSEPVAHGKNTIMLKIGRANNVTRRMNEWQRQCGYALNLVRWYPHVPSSATPSPQRSPTKERPVYPDLSRPPTGRRESDVVRKVQCVKRVERLIHLELAEKRVMKQCTACGKEHREWFEVEATQAGVREVDECVRRWSNWAEYQAVR